MRIYLSLTILAASLCIGCTTPSAPDLTPTFPTIFRNYDTARGGVQIFQIAYDQTKNGIATGDTDEWVVLMSTGHHSLTGWTLDANDPGQQYELPDSIYGMLTIYTHHAPDPTNKLQFGLNLSPGTFIWNNTSPDTCRLFDATGKLVDSMGYTKP